MTRKDQQHVESRLREEAPHARSEVTFSPLLHQRLMTALHHHGLAAEELPLRSPFLWRMALPLAVAAAVAIATWLLLQPAPEKPAQPLVKDPNPAPMQPILPLPQAPLAAAPESLSLATTSALDRGKYAYLDRDAEKLLTFVANQLPSLPSQQP